MESLILSNVTLVFTGQKRLFEEAGKQGEAEIVEISTTDGLRAEVALQHFSHGDINVRLTEFLTNPPPPVYSHLNRNGTMTVQVRDDGKWVALLRALRPGGREHPTLNNVSWDELDRLLESESQKWLETLGFETGTWSELNPKAARFKDSLAVAIPANQGALLAAPWALTRVVALMKKLGKTSVVELG